MRAPRTGRRAAFVALAGATALVLGGCSGGDEEPAKGASEGTSAVDVPEGVTLTEAGTEVAVGKPATVGYPVGEAASALTVTVASVKPGKASDLSGYVLDPASAASTPYYVSLDLRNDGPDPLGGAAVPVYGFDSTKTFFPPTTFAGEPFTRCPGGALPKTFDAGATAKACFVLLVPQGATLSSVQLRTDDLSKPVSWPVS
ncbi:MULTISPECIES: hypothetical protein [Mumia]|uniref:hypothetical protein n=1 Tax=Mumia TaxID=1546255 RepID=UPI0014208129|nr:MULTISPECIES: hypothetical protein [unclassified Mumia]QMW65142.1 hypothetical protein H4N58_13065 [Mumia sp. ZJ1417]